MRRGRSDGDRAAGRPGGAAREPLRRRSPLPDGRSFPAAEPAVAGAPAGAGPTAAGHACAVMMARHLGRVADLPAGVDKAPFAAATGCRACTLLDLLSTGLESLAAWPRSGGPISMPLFMPPFYVAACKSRDRATQSLATPLPRFRRTGSQLEPLPAQVRGPTRPTGAEEGDLQDRSSPAGEKE
jgi:hypothetical protein